MQPGWNHSNAEACMRKHADQHMHIMLVTCIGKQHSETNHLNTEHMLLRLPVVIVHLFKKLHILRAHGVVGVGATTHARPKLIGKGLRGLLQLLQTLGDDSPCKHCLSREAHLSFNGTSPGIKQLLSRAILHTFKLNAHGSVHFCASCHVRSESRGARNRQKTPSRSGTAW